MTRPLGLALLGLAFLSGCIAVRENVVYAPGRVKYPGYRVEYVEATPAPGALLQGGSETLFNVKVRYALQSQDKGKIVLYFRDKNGLPQLKGKEIWTGVSKGTGEASLSTEVVVPPNLFELWLWVPIIPDGLKDHPEGYVKIRYLVAPQ